MIKCMHPLMWAYQNTNVITILVGFERIYSNIVSFLLLKGYNAPLLLFKAGTKLDEGGISGASLNDLSEALQCILLDLFNNKPHARFLD